MNTQQRIVFIQSQIACMMVEMEGMKVLNKERELNCYSLAYDEEAFYSLIDKYNLSHKDVITYLVIS